MATSRDLSGGRRSAGRPHARPSHGQESLYVHRLGFLSLLPAAGLITLGVWTGIDEGMTVSSAQAGFGWGLLMVTFLLLLFFGQDLMSNESVGPIGRMIWGIAFLFAAPLSLPLYWLAYVRQLHPHEPGR